MEDHIYVMLELRGDNGAPIATIESKSGEGFTLVHKNPQFNRKQFMALQDMIGCALELAGPLGRQNRWGINAD